MSVSLKAVAGAALERIRQICRVLGLMRSGEPTTASYAPTPGLADLPTLVDEVAGAGLPVDLSVSGGRRQPAARRRAGRLPGRAGGAHQCPPPCPGAAGDRAGRGGWPRPASTADDRLASTKVLILSTFDLDEYVFQAIRAGASGFLLKETLPADLLAAVRVVAGGQALLAPSVTRRLLEEFARRPAAGAVQSPPGFDTLTSRELEVLVAVARGLSNTEIADSLFMSPATAKTHVSRVLAKLHARDRAQLVMLAYEAGIIAPGLA